MYFPSFELRSFSSSLINNIQDQNYPTSSIINIHQELDLKSGSCAVQLTKHLHYFGNVAWVDTWQSHNCALGLHAAIFQATNNLKVAFYRERERFFEFFASKIFWRISKIFRRRNKKSSLFEVRGSWRPFLSRRPEPASHPVLTQHWHYHFTDCSLPTNSQTESISLLCFQPLDVCFNSWVSSLEFLRNWLQLSSDL